MYEIPKEPCPQCNGKGGFIIGKPSDNINSASWVRCHKCKGTKKVDWVEAVMGKKPTTIKPGVYVKEVDYSYCIQPSLIAKEDLDQIKIFDVDGKEVEWKNM